MKSAATPSLRCGGKIAVPPLRSYLPTNLEVLINAQTPARMAQMSDNVIISRAPPVFGGNKLGENTCEGGF
jgi:hypothetical protein